MFNHVLFFVWLALCSLLPAVGNVSASDADWPLHGLDAAEQRFSPLQQINDTTVANLGLAWYVDTDYQRGMEATPIVVGGVLYFTGSWSVVYAVDARSGKLLWKYDPEVPKAWGKMACCDVVNRGVAVAEGKVVFGTLDARLIALDQHTGDRLWEVQTADTRRWPYTITGAPRVANGKVFIGNGGAEYGVRGFVSAYRLDDGERLWRFYTVPGNPADDFENEAMERAAQTWSGEWWRFGGGGTVWDAIVFDEELNQLYIGVGNGTPWDRRIRSPGGGDNLYLSSIVALDPDTGAYRWHYQETPAETWDYTATQPIMLAEMNWQGERRKVLWQAPKNGFFFILDRVTGELLSAEPYARVTWTSGYDMDTGRPIETPDGQYGSEGQFVLPSSAGAHNWQPMAHSPLTGLVYIPTIDAASHYRSNFKTEYEWGHWNTGIDMAVPGPDSGVLSQMLVTRITKGALLAWDPATQRAAWSLPHPQTYNGGVLATAGNLVFQGTADGYLLAVAADSGEPRWRFRVGAGVMAPPVTYTVDGEQYLSVLSGWGGAFGLAGGAAVDRPVPPGRLLTFKLGASAQLPVPVVVEPAELPLPPRPEASDATLALGRHVYQNYCFMCHGHGLNANGAVPDLRYLPMTFYDNWDAIVRDGVMSGAGMVGFADVLSKAETDALYDYVISEAYAHREETADGWIGSLRRLAYRGFTEAMNIVDGLQGSTADMR